LNKLSKKKITKICILGGTFDPPHIGHLYISKIVIKKLKLNKLIWAITKKNPLKRKPHLSLETRIYLAKKIANKEKKIYIKYYDNKVKYRNTFRLLKFIKKNNKNSKIFFLMGGDNLLKFHKWHNWKQIPKIATLVIFPRNNHVIKSRQTTAAKILDKKDLIYIKAKKIDISSSLIRKFW